MTFFKVVLYTRSQNLRDHNSEFWGRNSRFWFKNFVKDKKVLDLKFEFLHGEEIFADFLHNAFIEGDQFL